jgi:hypothetical protein
MTDSPAAGELERAVSTGASSKTASSACSLQCTVGIHRPGAVVAMYAMAVVMLR